MEGWCWLLQKLAQSQSKKYLYNNNSMKHTEVEIIKNRLYFMISDKPPKDIPKAFYFNIDNDLQYDAFYEDFGPVNICKVWKFISEVQKIMKDPKFKDNVFYHQTSCDHKKSSNAALLICCSQMILNGVKADQVWKPFSKINFVPFRDASYGACSFECTILDCLRGLQYAMKLGWFDFKTFNPTQYEHYERVENGDMNWVIPGKFVAFSSPSGKKKDEYGNTLLTPKDYLPVFKKFGVTSVIRLNTVTYNRQQFIENGIRHYQLYFPDGTSPPKDIVMRFLQTTETDQVFAVHCKAGLGRTGTLIACYAMKHYFFNATDFIGWIRLCRPGSILGPQQHFLIEIEKEMKELGMNSSIWKEVSAKFDQKQIQHLMKRLSVKNNTKMNEQQKKIELLGDNGQGERLVNRKKQAVKG